MKTDFDKSELVVIFQALVFREAILLNTQPGSDIWKQTKELKEKIASQIRTYDLVGAYDKP